MLVGVMEADQDGLAALPTFQAVSSEAFGAPARRPLYSVLDLTEGEAILGRSLPSWQSALRRFLSS